MIYRDPRAGMKDPEIRATVFFVFSLPDPEEAKQWARENGLPPRAWDAKMQRVRVYGRFVPVLEKLERATIDQVKEWQERAKILN